MAARGNVIVNDGEAVPVAHTFTPAGDIAEGVAMFHNRNVAVPAATEVFTVSVRTSPSRPEDYSIPGKKVSPRVTEIRFKYPSTYIDAVSGLTLVDFVDEAVYRFMVHPRSTDQRAKNLRTMTSGTMATAVIAKAVESGEFIW